MDFGNIDFVLESSDNDKQHGEDEVIKISEQEPLNDSSCQHTKPQLDGDRIGDTISVTCYDCPKGWYIPVHEAKKLFPKEFTALK